MNKVLSKTGQFLAENGVVEGGRQKNTDDRFITEVKEHLRCC